MNKGHTNQSGTLGENTSHFTQSNSKKYQIGKAYWDTYILV